MRPGFSKKLFVGILGLVTVGAASACSCRHIGFENLVLDKQLSLAKIVIMPPSLTERVASFLDLFKAERTYTVKVVEVITGRYDATAITARPSGSTDCGISLRHGETYYLRVSSAAAGDPLRISVCDLVNAEYIRQVKAYKRRPKPELSPVPPGSWSEVFRDGKQTVHANYLGVTSDSHGQYIWILRNFAEDSVVKSKKEQLQIACKERQYNVVSRHEFSGMDASGDVISSVNLRKQGRYQWLPLKPDIDGLLPVVCKGQLKRPPS